VDFEFEPIRAAIRNVNRLRELQSYIWEKVDCSIGLGSSSVWRVRNFFLIGPFLDIVIFFLVGFFENYF